MFKPLNRHIQIEIGKNNPNETDLGILLPEDFSPTEQRYEAVTVVSAAEDVKFLNLLEKGTRIIIDKSMVEEINFENKSINVILENYILGIVT
jgi:co-chaperonin GroES (HSP10)